MCLFNLRAVASFCQIIGDLGFEGVSARAAAAATAAAADDVARREEGDSFGLSAPGVPWLQH